MTKKRYNTKEYYMLGVDERDRLVIVGTEANANSITSDGSLKAVHGLMQEPFTADHLKVIEKYINTIKDVTIPQETLQWLKQMKEKVDDQET